MRKVLIVDTSILCVWLSVPGKESCGSDADRWDKRRVDQVLDRERANKTTFVLPLATIIETGNHIAQAPGDRFARASELGKLIALTADGTSPWAAFTQQSELWSPEGLRALSTTWPHVAANRLSIGDATIGKVAAYYADCGYAVEILTGDAQLKALEPRGAARVPRRRSR
ncbi:MAG: hypothetical protein U0359_02815 [Byssovorax sp.]